MNAQHTPGPWHVAPASHIPATHPDAHRFLFWQCRHVATAPEIGDCDDPAEIICDLRDGPNQERNARLISAAPELLEALERLVDDYERVKRFAHDNGLQWVGSSQAPDWQARQVIAKARGQA